ncbi:MAG: hypothetical protein V4651_03890, partial [Bacteroidota bacterium]
QPLVKLIHCNIRKNKKKISIYLTNELHHGLDIDLLLEVEQHSYKVRVFYNAININEVSELNVIIPELKLSTDKFEKGKILAGTILLNFNGSITSAETGQKEIITGTASGPFKALIE